MNEIGQLLIDMAIQFLSSCGEGLKFILKPIILMPIAMLLIVSVIVYIFQIKKYKEGAYYNITKVPFHLLRRDIGRYGEYLTYKYLQHFEKDGAKFLFNVYIPKDNGETTEIDVLMLTKKGFFVFESKNYSGWIFGNENQKNWYQTLPSGRGRSHKAQFYNPIMQNRSHIKHLRALIGEQVPMYSVVVFSERCTLKNVTIKSDEIKVIKRNQVASAVSDICKTVSSNFMTDEDIANIYGKLYSYTQISEEEKVHHILDIKNHLEEKISSVSDETIVKITTVETNLQESGSAVHIPVATIAERDDAINEPLNVQSNNTENTEIDNICPRCGGKLVLRTASKGANAGNQFWGCTNFPKCRFTIK